MGLLRSKVAGIVFAAVLVGLTGSGLAVLTAAQPASTLPNPAGAALANGSSTSPASTAASPTGGSSNPGDSAAPTDTTVPAPAATRTPRPTPTAPAIGSSVDLNGRVVSVNVSASSFVLNVSGRLYTCVVNANGSTTTWSGPVHSISALQRDMAAEVKGVLQDIGTVLAKDVNAQPDN